MKDNRIIVAMVKSHAGHEAYVAARIDKLAELTRQESGCLRYEIYRDPHNKGATLIYEIWSTHAKWRDHVATDHLQDFKETVLKDKASMRVEILSYASETG